MSKRVIDSHRRRVAVWMTHAAGLMMLILLSGCGGRRAIMGRVIDETGTPVQRAEISTEPTTDIVLTNSKGIFSIRQILMDNGEIAPIETGQYTLTVRQLGFEDLILELDYDGGVVKLPELEMVRKTMDFDPTAPDPTQFKYDPGNDQTPIQGT